MRIVNLVLIIIFILIQYRFWFGHNGLQFYTANRTEVTKLKSGNDEFLKRNILLEADVKDLSVGLEGIEERARNELGMIRENETFFRLVPNNKEQN
ncbi:cell division protein FtsB [Psychrosphaera aquimarina]|uniref:Cell division protein FtsB n=1 Tax=Psychrosphaera aquimarina TaxID=2044854 RepID=A0ABU3R2X5_9GAMM|nr:cell division protein FtsB [Psychrosphaera aquimarina]MDU0114037.1 cell division protein FtsB [Psychrosphaera aquimarina]